MNKEVEIITTGKKDEHGMQVNDLGECISRASGGCLSYCKTITSEGGGESKQAC